VQSTRIIELSHDYEFARHGLLVAGKTIANFVQRLTRPYKQSHNANRMLGGIRVTMGRVQDGGSAKANKNPAEAGSVRDIS
jgi:hypothetical protein